MKSFILIAVIVGAASAQLLFPPHFDSFGPFGRPEAGKKCKDASDCAPEECCIHGGHFGKRDVLDDDNFGDWLGNWKSHFENMFTGYCKPLRKEGEFCVPFAQEVNVFETNAHFGMCPCSTGLECTSDKKVEDHPVFGKFETHTNTMCSKPENVEGSGDGN